MTNVSDIKKENNDKILDKKIIIINEQNNKIIEKKIKDNIIMDNKIDIIREQLENEINILLKNKGDFMNDLKKRKKNIIFNSNWNVSSNFKLNTFNNDNNVLYKNKFNKNPNIKEKLINENLKSKGIILPEIKTQNIKKDNVNVNISNNLFSHFVKIPKEALVNNINSETKNEISCDKNNIFRNIKLNKIIKIKTNANDTQNTQTTQSATNSIKNQTSSKNSIIPNINLKDDMSKYEMGLISTGATTNNSIMIPILTLKRPVSELTTGEKVINHNIEIDGKKGNDIINENIITKPNSHSSSQKTRNHNLNVKQLYKNNNISLKNKEMYNLFSGVQKLMPNFHKIKIEKGMMNNNKLLNSFSRKISYDYKSKNSLNFNDIKFKSIEIEH